METRGLKARLDFQQAVLVPTRLCVFVPESSSVVSVHIVGDEEFSTPDHRVGDDQLSARV